jgi:hypothetical protein
VNKPIVFTAGALALGAFMAFVDFTSGPSQSLLAFNSTVLSGLTIILVGLLVIAWTERAPKEAREHFRWARRTPLKEMVETLRGARDGYVSNRRDIARTLRWAVEAEIEAAASSRPREEVDAYLERILDARSFLEFFSESQWRTAKVEVSVGYITRLRGVVASVEQSLGF